MNEPKNGIDVLAEVNGTLDVIEVRRPKMSPGWRIGQKDFDTWDDVKSHFAGMNIQEVCEV